MLIIYRVFFSRKKGLALSISAPQAIFQLTQ